MPFHEQKQFRSQKHFNSRVLKSRLQITLAESNHGSGMTVVRQPQATKGLMKIHLYNEKERRHAFPLSFSPLTLAKSSGNRELRVRSFQDQRKAAPKKLLRACPRPTRPTVRGWLPPHLPSFTLFLHQDQPFSFLHISSQSGLCYILNPLALPLNKASTRPCDFPGGFCINLSENVKTQTSLSLLRNKISPFSRSGVN